MSTHSIQRLTDLSISFPKRQMIFIGLAVALHLLVLSYLNHVNNDSAVALTTTSTSIVQPTSSTVSIRLQSTAARSDMATEHRSVKPQIANTTDIHTKEYSQKTTPASAIPTDAPVAELALQASTPQETDSQQNAQATETSPRPGISAPPAESTSIPQAKEISTDTATKAMQNNNDTSYGNSNMTDIATLSIAPPPSGIIKMKLIRTEPQRNPVYGVGEISWNVQDGKYRMRIQAALDLLLTTLHLYQLDSEGTLGRFGITPGISTETRRGRSATATHFDSLANTISFSSSNQTIGMSDGAQDKASVFMQLAGIGQADASQFVEGRSISVQVAEDRNATIFQFRILGQEEIDTKLGKLSTWHLIRPPRPGSYNSTLDLWLAPAYAWYPVQIRNTESNGAVTTQTATQINYTQ